MSNNYLLSSSKQPFGTLPNGEAVSQYHLSNNKGLTVKLIDYGATLVSVKIPEQNNSEIVLGFDTLEEYLKHEFYFGCTVGRVANRIAQGKFSYQGKAYQLACNDKQPNHIHGGCKGFDKVLWRAESFTAIDSVGVRFYYLSKDNEEGYPGNLKVTTTYLLTDANELKIIFQAETDKATPVDLTNHTYWNLAGAGADNVLKHELQVFADNYVVTDQHHIPSGEIRSVQNTSFDFRKSTAIGARIQEVAGGYDLCFALDKSSALKAHIVEPNTKRSIELYTTQPGLQFYTGNYLYDYPIADSKHTAQYGGFCFETQNFPDAVNHTNFPSPILTPGKIYQHETVYKLEW
jgi:aldose 1-epimerase